MTPDDEAGNRDGRGSRARLLQAEAGHGGCRLDGSR